MCAAKDQALYKAGVDKELDLLFSKYKRSRIFAGKAVSEALTSKEVDIMVDIWKKERSTPQKLYVYEVRALVVGL